jgi:ketosteroid isomerase-like protein
MTLSPAASEAAKVVDAFHAALAGQDTTSAAALLSDSALIFEGGYVERSKAEYASHHLGADAAYASVVPTSLVKRSGFAEGDVAWIASETRTTGTYKDKPVDRLSTETMILKRRHPAGGSFISIGHRGQLPDLGHSHEPSVSLSTLSAASASASSCARGRRGSQLPSR